LADRPRYIHDIIGWIESFVRGGAPVGGTTAYLGLFP
jgi:hypothetical protein